MEALSGAYRDVSREYETGQDRMVVTFRCLSAAGMRVTCEFLREQREAVLLERSVDELARVLDAASEKWLDPSYRYRRQAIDQINALTGFSPETVAHSIDLEMKSSRYQHLMQALRNEIGNPSYLDGFQENPNLCGFTRAYGPALVGAIFSSNIPALPHLEVMRTILLKSSCVGRVSAGEPIFLSLYARSLSEIDSSIASCLAVTYWEREDFDCETAFLGSIDHIVAYGGDSQIQRLMSAKPNWMRATWHGHKLGVAYVTRGALGAGGLRELARKIAYDFSIFDGHACLCPQVCFVERGGETDPLGFSAACAEQMRYWQQVLPPRKLDISAASRKYHTKEMYLMREMMGEDVVVVDAPEDLSFMAVLENTDQIEASPGDRFLRVIPVDNAADVERMLGPLARHLQCAALACGPDESVRMSEVAGKLAALGISRIVPPGIMGTPSMMWHHDGEACLAKMLRWCDIELLRPEEMLELTGRADAQI